ncbi:MAG: LON peptidase substrate-binding domain-containing protein [Betaproteobacteria bacterium]
MSLSIPIFPLHAVLYPGGLLALKIFEQRYLDMTKACVRDGTPFGVCRIREGQEVGVPAVAEQIGCTAVIAQWEMPHLGLFELRTRGEKPFRILKQSTQANGLIHAEVEMLSDAAGDVQPESFDLCRQVLEQVVEKIGADYFDPPLAFDDPRWTSYRLSEVLPLDGSEKQALLELRDDGARLERLRSYLQMAA